MCSLYQQPSLLQLHKLTTTPKNGNVSQGWEILLLVTEALDSNAQLFLPKLNYLKVIYGQSHSFRVLPHQYFLSKLFTRRKFSVVFLNSEAPVSCSGNSVPEQDIEYRSLL